MEHPGPPRFVTTGEEVELAPRDPDPEATYTWWFVQRPEGATATLGDAPVEHFTPDTPGTYVARLGTVDAEYDLTVRVFGGNELPASRDADRVSGGWQQRTDTDDTPAGASGYGATDRADREGGGGRPRLTLDPAVETGRAVVRPEVTPHPDSDETADDIDVEFLLDDRDTVDPDAITVEDRTLWVPLSALPELTRVHAVAVGSHGVSVPDAVTFTREADPTGDAGTVATGRPYDPPAWGPDSVIYEIYVRTFADPHTEGSVFDALVDRLEYIDSLGVDVLWLTPVLENDHAPHGYNIRDFFSIAEDLGTRADYERFVEAAHDRGLKVLFDLVCNHSARTHPFFEAAVTDPDSKYRDWYEWRTDTEPETYFDWPHIANFDFDHLPVRRYLLDVVEAWAPLVDGFRCDMAWAVPAPFWQELHDRTKAMDPEFLLLDETIPYVPKFQAGLFDMHFDSTTYHEFRQVGQGEPADRVVDAIENRAQIGFPDHAGFMLYTENHDETRYIADCGRPAAKAALGGVFTLPGAPLLYAGQEFGQLGRRDDLAWEHADEALQDHVRALAAARHDHPALAADAEFVRVPYEVTAGDPDRVVAYGRSAKEAAAAVVLNFGEAPATVSVPAAADTVDVVSGADVRVTGEGPTVTVDSVVVLPAAADRLEPGV